MSEKKIDLVDRKLGRENALGIAWKHGGLIEIDPRQSTLDRLDSVVHEALHIIFPDLSERKVAATAKKIAKLLWKDRWRRLDS